MSISTEIDRVIKGFYCIWNINGNNLSITGFLCEGNLPVTSVEHSSQNLFSPKFWLLCFNSSPPCATYMLQSFRSALVQIMACRLFGAKPLFKPMLCYCEILIKIPNFSFTRMHLNISSAKWLPFCPGIDELIQLEKCLTIPHEIWVIQEYPSILAIIVILPMLLGSGWGVLVWVQYRIFLQKSSQTQIPFVHNIHFCCQIILQFCTEHGSITTVLCEKNSKW